MSNAKEWLRERINYLVEDEKEREEALLAVSQLSDDEADAAVEALAPLLDEALRAQEEDRQDKGGSD